MSPLKIKLLAAMLLLPVLVAALLLAQVNSEWHQPLSLEATTLLKVNKGESLHQLCRRMTEKNWLAGCFSVKVLSKIQPDKAQIKSGTYEVTPGTTLNDLIVKLVQGIEHQFVFTIIEGENIYQVVDKINETANIKNDLKPIEQLSNQFAVSYDSLEGLLAPNSYFYTEGTHASKLLKRAIEQQSLHLEDVWQARQADLPVKNKYDLLILASIIEKESALASEHRKIASVFYNRLKRNMRLQTDPTVIYGVWNEYEGDIKRVHLKTKTPYNTYRINGLPPTPISNPSLMALKAAADPETTDLLYFVASGDGGHVFNKTLSEHNKALRQYLKKQKERSQ